MTPSKENKKGKLKIAKN